MTIDEAEVTRIADFVLEGVSHDDVQAEALAPRKAAKRRTKAELKAEAEVVPVYDVKTMSPQELQELALQNLVNELANGSGVAASKELLSFTEDVYVSSNKDLEGMAPEELLGAMDALRLELQHIINKETIGI
jgi:hypothetical protein